MITKKFFRNKAVSCLLAQDANVARLLVDLESQMSNVKGWI